MTAIKVISKKKVKTGVIKNIKASAPTQSMIGSTAPNIDIQSSDGKVINLTKLSGKKIVLYFYPKDDTPGCTLEGHEFNKLLPEFKKSNCVIFGISRDPQKSHEKFISKCGFNFELLSDIDEKFCKFFDVIKQKNMYGKMVYGIERSTFIFSVHGKITNEFRKIKAEGHAAEILKAVQAIKD